MTFPVTYFERIGISVENEKASPQPMTGYPSPYDQHRAEALAEQILMARDTEADKRLLILAEALINVLKELRTIQSYRGLSSGLFD